METNLKDLMESAGVETLRPSNTALVKMNISRRRFTQLIENINKTPITLEEHQSIQDWIKGISRITESV